MSHSAAGPGDESAGRAAERLAERRRDDVDFAEHAEMLGRAATGLAEHAGRVRVVHRRRSRRGRARSRRISGSFAIAAFHREHAVGPDDAPLRALRARELRAQVVHVGVLVDRRSCTS